METLQLVMEALRRELPTAMVAWAIQSVLMMIAAWTIWRAIRTERSLRPRVSRQLPSRLGSKPMRWTAKDLGRGERPLHVCSREYEYEISEILRRERGITVCSALMQGRWVHLKISVNHFGQAALMNEANALRAVTRQPWNSHQAYLPDLVESFSSRGSRLNVFTPPRAGFFSAAEILRQHPTGLHGRHLGWMFNRLLEVLGYAHEMGWILGRLNSENVLFHAADHGLLLPDWTVARPRQHFADTGKDLTRAAKLVVQLAGGHPLNQTIPPQIPREIRRFLQACLLESPSMRPHDAWQLRDEFMELLEDEYGPPEFCQLEMISE